MVAGSGMADERPVAILGLPWRFDAQWLNTELGA